MEAAKSAATETDATLQGAWSRAPAGSTALWSLFDKLILEGEGLFRHATFRVKFILRSQQNLIVTQSEFDFQTFHRVEICNELVRKHVFSRNIIFCISSTSVQI